MGRCFHIEEVNSYYKGFPVFENLIHLQLVWFYDAKYDWDEIVKMLQNCPKLQTLYISKVCKPNPWIVISFCLFFSLIILTNHVLSLMNSGRSFQKPTIIGNTHIMFLNVFPLILQHVVLYTIKLWKPIFDLQSIYCRMLNFYGLWKFSIVVTHIQWRAPNF